MRKPGFTIEQHEQLGLELQTMRDRLVKITVELSRAYPLKVADIASKATDTIDALRNRLDNEVCKENPSIKDVTKAYYRANRPDYQPPE